VADVALAENGRHLLRFDGAGVEGVLTLDVCADPNSDLRVTAYFYDDYPYATMEFGAPPSYGAMWALQASGLECCAVPAYASATVPVHGARAVRIYNNNEDFLHLNEIEILDADGNNLALAGKCYSFRSGYGGDSGCLNDGFVGTYPTACSSHSSWMDLANYDLCVMAETSDIATVNVYPWVDPDRLWMTDRLSSLRLEPPAHIGV
jgi:hypothetical protein